MHFLIEILARYSVTVDNKDEQKFNGDKLTTRLVWTDLREKKHQMVTAGRCLNYHKKTAREQTTELQ